MFSSSIIADVILHDPSMYSNTTIQPTSWMSKREPEPSPGPYDSYDTNWTEQRENSNSTNAWSSSVSSDSGWTPSTSSASDWSASSTGQPRPSSSHCLSCSSGSSSSGSSAQTADALLSTLANATISNTVNTTFYTTDGLVSISYLAHPPRTALVSWIATNQGDMDIAFHPNFVGPFAIRNAWGAIRLPRPRKRVWDDPLGLGRMRAVVEGVIAVGNDTSAPVQGPGMGDGSGDTSSTDDGDDSGPNGTGTAPTAPGSMNKTAVDDYMFTRAGLNETLLSTSGTTVTGAAYWQAGLNGTLSPKAVQSSTGRRGTAVVLGGWGDVTVSFDGR